MWTFVGRQYPARQVKVEIRDDDSPAPDETVQMLLTDAGDRYRAPIDNDDGIRQGGRDVFIRVVACALPLGPDCPLVVYQGEFPGTSTTSSRTETPIATCRTGRSKTSRSR